MIRKGTIFTNNDGNDVTVHEFRNSNNVVVECSDDTFVTVKACHLYSGDFDAPEKVETYDEG